MDINSINSSHLSIAMVLYWIMDRVVRCCLGIGLSARRGVAMCMRERGGRSWYNNQYHAPLECGSEELEDYRYSTTWMELRDPER